MDKQTPDKEQLKDALGHCLGVYSIEADGRCEGCPLYEDHYCVDTLMSIVGGMIDEHFDGRAAGLGAEDP